MVHFGRVRFGIDMSTGHPPWPSTVPAQGSTNAFMDNFPQVRVTDPWVMHCSPTPPSCHVPTTAQGSTVAFTDNLPTHRQTDKLSCGDMAATGSVVSFSG